eukprot:TRINITY_DN23994_c0_g1_i1.p1 TRINITY_DN23994_c0_g1~~TRINITY_DN23994_c0_g1_i1.p1  ORF type:complete len:132 (+),score=17.59 TRINITY_DN23994_c0_g1_i1:92-487(+)
MQALISSWVAFQIGIERIKILSRFVCLVLQQAGRLLDIPPNQSWHVVRWKTSQTARSHALQPCLQKRISSSHLSVYVDVFRSKSPAPTPAPTWQLLWFGSCFDLAGPCSCFDLAGPWQVPVVVPTWQVAPM